MTRVSADLSDLTPPPGSVSDEDVSGSGLNGEQRWRALEDRQPPEEHPL